MPVKMSQIIHIQPEAAAKPVLGEPCNGCGVCCLSEPCPLGMLLSRRRSGVCMALHWNDAVHQYRCGALTDAALVLRQALPRGLGWLAPVAAPLLGAVRTPLDCRWPGLRQQLRSTRSGRCRI